MTIITIDCSVFELTAHLLRLEDQKSPELNRMIAWSRDVGPMIKTAGTPDNPTLGKLIADWVFIQMPVSVALRNEHNYLGWYKNHVIPAMGHIRVKSITRGMIKDFLAGKSADGLSDATVNSLKDSISHAFTRAIDQELISGNPCMKLKGYLKRGDHGVEGKSEVKPFRTNEGDSPTDSH